ncbi:MAG: replicative DNA helicase [Candidatus Gracilibacteria bacterium]|nr:replicative DNA helicase [Candidatus Gracilibacteria bacterium]
MLKVPPHSIEAEQSVLGSILIDKDCFITIGDLLKDSDFYVETNSIIFGVMFDLYKHNKPIDLITVKEKLDDKKLLDKIGGISYLAELTEIVPTTANVFEYAQIVKNKAVLRNLIKAGNEIISYGYDEDKSINDLLEKTEKSVFNVTQVFIQNKLVHINEILEQRFEEFAEIHENPDLIKEHRLHLGFKDLDHKFNGLKGGDMVILAARPSMGKTAFALNLAQNVGYNGKNVAIFSLEMSKEQLTDRMIASAMQIDSWKLAKGELEDHEFAKIGEAMEKLSQANIYIDDSAGGNLVELKSKCRRLKIESGLDLIVIDYLQLMSNGNSMNRVQEISEISRGIKSLARELNVPIIALSQLSRTVEQRPDKRPIMSDLRESGSIEQDADIIMMLYREEYYDEFTEKKGITDVLVRKNRNGPIGNIELMFEKNNQKFVEVERNYGGGGNVEEY